MPMRILRDFAHPQRQAPALAILLPGALQQPEDFAGAGFIDAVRRRRLPLDLALADLGLDHVGEAVDGSAARRVDEHLVQPARQAGYREVWLAGISIGGFIALAHAAHYPDRVSRLCLLAPYPGSRIVTNEINAAGGLEQWQSDADDAERSMWRWLNAHRAQPASPHVHLGYGRDDRFAAGLRLMAQALPACCTDVSDGGHDWPAWQRLWDNFLDRVAPHFHNNTMNTAA